MVNHQKVGKLQKLIKEFLQVVRKMKILGQSKQMKLNMISKKRDIYKMLFKNLQCSSSIFYKFSS